MSVTEISAELESEFDAVASLTGEPKGELLREALLAYLEDFHLGAAQKNGSTTSATVTALQT